MTEATHTELEKIANEILEIAEADREYIIETNQDVEYKKGWREGIDQVITELLGRQSEDKVEKLKEVIEK